MKSDVRRLTFTASLALLLVTAPGARAATKTYVGADNGAWNTAANWNPGGVPAQGDVVTLGASGISGTDYHVNYNSTQGPTLSSLTLNSAAISGFMIVNQTSTTSVLNVGSWYIGTTVAKNTWNQSDGSNIYLSLDLGVNSGSTNNTYNLSGNGLLRGDVVGNLRIGVSGAGVFNQTGGTNTSAGGDSSIGLGINAGGSGTYNLSGGSMTPGTTLVVGVAGTGLFKQTGGTASTPELDIGNAGGNGTYNLSAGTFSATAATVGAGGTGVFNQTGTNATITTLKLGDPSGTGTYNLSVGNLSSSSISVGVGGTGIFNQTGGGVTATALGVGGSTGTGTYNLSVGTVSAPVTVGSGGTFNLQGGTLTGNVTVNPGGLFSLKSGSFGAAPLLTMTGGEFRLNTNGVTLTGLAGTGGSILSNSTSALDFDSVATVTLNGNANVNFGGTIGNSTGGFGLVGLTKNGAFTQTLSGANTYSGPTAVNAGRLTAGSTGGFSASSAYTTVSGATLDANGFNVLIGSLEGTGGTVEVDTGSLGLGYNSRPTTFGGSFTGSGTLTKAGTGELTLTGVSSFNGTLNVTGGSVRVGATNGAPVGAILNLFGPNASLNLGFDQTFAGLAGTGTAAVNFLSNNTLVVNNNTQTLYAGTFAGGGELRKLGAGNLILGGGPSDTVASMTAGSSLKTNVYAGTLLLNKADGTTAVGGPLGILGGTVALNRGNQIADSTAVTINSGALNLNGYNETIGTLDGTGGTISNGGTLTVTQSANKAYNGALVGGGSFVKNGPSPLTLTGLSNYGGTFTSNSDHLYLQGPVNATGGTANSGGILDFLSGTANLNNGTILSKSGAFVQYFGATVNNAFLRGPGPHIIVGGGYPASTLNNVTTYNSTTLFQNGPATLSNFTNGGIIQNNAALTFDGALNEISGTLRADSTVTTSDFSSSGVINVSKFGALSNSGSNLVLGGGSRTYVGTAAAPGGAFVAASGTSIELNGGLFVNYGTQGGTLNVNYGSTAKGPGAFGAVNVSDGGRFGVNAAASGVAQTGFANIRLADSQGLTKTAFVGPQLAAIPATATTASLALGSGSVFAFTVQDAAGAAGTGYDLVHVTGALTLAAGSAFGDQITLSVSSLDATGVGGPAGNFDPANNYVFVLVQADGGITGFAPGEFVVDSAGFKNPITGSFTVLQQGNDLVLAYNAVPEPGAWSLLVAGAGGALLLVCRRQRRSGGSGAA